MEFEIDDIIEIIDSGEQYTTYVSMAMELGADVSKHILKDLSENEGSFRNFDHVLVREDRSCKWIYDNDVSNGDVCKLTSISDSGHYLVERIFDSREFILSEYGMKIIGRVELFSDGDFLL